MKKYIAELLSNFKWYRKIKGGIWYRVYDIWEGGGMQSTPTYWRRKIPGPDWEVLEVENFDL